MSAPTDIVAGIEALYQLALRGHYGCDDTWYSCPKHEDGCADDGKGRDCNCGTDEHNARVNEVFTRLMELLANGL